MTPHNIQKSVAPRHQNLIGRQVYFRLSAKKLKESILPQLALQFNHFHYVKYFRKWQGSDFLKGKVEIRILDYEIDRASSTSPADLLFK